MATFAGQTITSGEITIPAYGGAWADVSIDQAVSLVGAASIVVGDLTLSGDIEQGGITNGVASYQWRSDLRWMREITKRRSYQIPNGVRLKTVLADLALDLQAADRGFVLPPDRSLGEHYARPSSDARRPARGRDVLRQLGVRWYVSPNGGTICGARAGGAITAEAVIQRRDMGMGIRYIRTERPAAFVPGKTFDGITIDHVIIRIAPNDYSLDLWGTT